MSEKYIFYHYDPSLPAAVIFICLFVSTTFVHIFQLGRMRTWSFIPFAIGGFFEIIGYAGRVVSATQTPNWATIPYVIQSLLLLLAPALFAASIYMVLGRIIRLTDGESHAIIKPKWITKLFVTGDVLSFLAQSAGGGLLAQAKTIDDTHRGNMVIIVGLAIQVAFFGFFVIVASLFHYRMNVFPSTRSLTLQVPWQRFLFVLYSASGFIMVRSIFRMIEYIQGTDGSLASNEVFLYVFDAVLMFSAMVLFNIWHPSRIIANEKIAGMRGVESSENAFVMADQGRGTSAKKSAEDRNLGR